MKSKRNLIIGVCALVVIIAGAVIAYQFLSDNVELTPPQQEQDQQQSPAAGFTVEDTAGNAAALADIVGPVVLNFWTTWCPSCTRMLPVLDTLYHEFGDEVTFMMINLVGSRGENPVRSLAYIEDRGYAFPIYFDTASEAARAFGVRYLPTTVFINADGSSRQIVGQRPEAELRQYIEQILG